jgi:hypothetical protein
MILRLLENTTQVIQCCNPVRCIADVLHDTSRVVELCQVRLHGVGDCRHQVFFSFLFGRASGMWIVSYHVHALVVDRIHQLGQPTNFTRRVVPTMHSLVHFYQNDMFLGTEQIIRIPRRWCTWQFFSRV